MPDQTISARTNASSLTTSGAWPYIAAAALLPDFDPMELQPLGGGSPKIGLISQMLAEYGETIKSGPARGRWRLSDAARWATLTELTRQNLLHEALRANPLTDNSTHRAITEMLNSNSPPLLQGKLLADLLGLERALEWLGPAVANASEYQSQVRAQIDRERLLEPLRRLLADGFAGRVDQLRELREYVDELPPESFGERLSRGLRNVIDIFRHSPPLVIQGPGGVGKSSLVAKFIIDHSDFNNPGAVPLIYLDFDNSQLDATEPDTLVAEASRQIQVQFPDLAKQAGELGELTQRRLEVADAIEISRSAHFGASTQLRQDLVLLLRQIMDRSDRNLLLFIDTFEIVQRRGLTAQYNVLKLAAELLAAARRLRVVIAGRAGIREEDMRSFSHNVPRPKTITLEGFDPLSGRVCLRKRLAKFGMEGASNKVLDRIVTLVRGNPLSLRLAARIFAQQGLEALEGAVNQARFDAAFCNEQLQGVLQGRILEHLPEHLRKIADPGLIVRRITPDVIAEILAGPCDLDLSRPGEADRLFNDLHAEVALMEPVGPRVLRHRSDVRLLMLPLLRIRLGPRARQIDEAAVRFWQLRTEPEARAEELYHRLWLQHDDSLLDECWRRGPVARPPMDEALDELDALDQRVHGRVWLCRTLKREFSPALAAQSDLSAWEHNAELRARNLLSSGAASEALNAIRERPIRSQTSTLWLLELETLKLLGRDREAFVIVERALTEADDANAPLHVQALLTQKAVLLERADRVREALDCVKQAAELADLIHDDLLTFTTGLGRLRLERKLDHRVESADLPQKLATLLGRQEVQAALKLRPSLQMEAAAELGDWNPQLLVDATRLLGEGDQDVQAQVLALNSLGSASTSAGRIDEALKAFEEAAALCRNRKSLRLLALTLNNHGTAYLQIEQIERSNETYREALAIAQQTDDHRLARRILGNLGSVHRGAGHYAEALEHYHLALAETRHSGDDGAAILLQCNIAAVFVDTHQLQEAQFACSEALTRARKLNDLRFTVWALGKLGIVLQHLGEVAKARELFEEQLVLSQQLGHTRFELAALTNLGTVLLHFRTASNALLLCERQFELSQKFGDERLKSKALGHLVITRRQAGMTAALQSLPKEIVDLLDGPQAEQIRKWLSEPEPMGIWFEGMTHSEEIGLSAFLRNQVDSSLRQTLK